MAIGVAVAAAALPAAPLPLPLPPAATAPRGTSTGPAVEPPRRMPAAAASGAPPGSQPPRPSPARRRPQHQPLPGGVFRRGVRLQLLLVPEGQHPVAGGPGDDEEVGGGHQAGVVHKELKAAAADGRERALAVEPTTAAEGGRRRGRCQRGKERRRLPKAGGDPKGQPRGEGPPNVHPPSASSPLELAAA